MATRTGNRVKLDGAEELRHLLKNMAPREAQNLARATVHTVAGMVRDELKRKVKHRSGALAKSIKAYRRRSTERRFLSEVRGGHSAPYMLMLEFGTRKTKAQPFIVPTTENFRPKVPALFREAFGKALEKSLARQARTRARVR